jgi:hypothetical protein
MLNLQHRKVENEHNCGEGCDQVKSTIKKHATEK